MKTKFLIAACIALAVATGIAWPAGAGEARKPAWKRTITSSPVSDWAMCRMLLADRRRLVPSYGADYFKPAKPADVGKLMKTTVGPASGSKAAFIEFRAFLRERNLKKAGRFIDQRQIIWLEPGREVMLKELTADGVATIRPRDGFMPMYVFDWSIKRAE